MKLEKLSNYFRQAEVVAENSPDAQTKVGVLIVDKEDGAIIMSSWNGFIRGANDSVLPKTRPAKYEVMQHAEQNAICLCAKRGNATNNCFAVVTLSPCKDCMRTLWQSGISTIYFKDKYKDFDDQLKMLDLDIELTKVGNFYKIELGVK